MPKKPFSTLLLESLEVGNDPDFHPRYNRNPHSNKKEREIPDIVSPSLSKFTFSFPNPSPKRSHLVFLLNKKVNSDSQFIPP